MSEKQRDWLSPPNVLALLLAIVAGVSSWNAWASNSGERITRVETRVDANDASLSRIENKIDRLLEARQ